MKLNKIFKKKECKCSSIVEDEIDCPACNGEKSHYGCSCCWGSGKIKNITQKFIIPVGKISKEQAEKSLKEMKSQYKEYWYPIKKNKKIGVFGLWHLGCVISASWSKLGYTVLGYDYDLNNINNLKEGCPPIYEPKLEETIKHHLNTELNFTDNKKDLLDCDYVFLAYDTPVDDNDNSDTSILEKSIIDLSEILKDNSIVIISSQSPIGYCSKLREILKSKNDTLELAYSPENLRLGDAIDCYLNPERIILGTNDLETEKRCLSLFDDIQTKDNILCMSLESAEMVKHGINSFLATSIVFANHLSDICSETGANINDVIKGIKSDNRIGNKAYLSPGVGFSGGTLGRDLKVLAQVNNNIREGGNWKPAKIFENIHTFNSNRKYSIVSKITKKFDGLKDKNIGILGLTYKPGTSTLRRSIPLEIVNLLIKNGANIKVFDPKANYNELSEINFEIKNSMVELIEEVDFIILLTEWSEFKEFDWININKNITLFDTKNFLKIENQKIKYYSI
jgi:UDPglucose 6-dehydrogenase